MHQGGQPQGRLAFAVLTAEKTTDGSCSIRLDSLRLVDGTAARQAAGPWLCPVTVFLENAGHQAIDSLIIAHPLVDELEAPDENGRLQRIIRSRDSHTIYLRFAWQESVRFLRFTYPGAMAPAISSTLSLNP